MIKKYITRLSITVSLVTVHDLEAKTSTLHVVVSKVALISQKRSCWIPSRQNSSKGPVSQR